MVPSPRMPAALRALVEKHGAGPSALGVSPYAHLPGLVVTRADACAAVEGSSHGAPAVSRAYETRLAALEGRVDAQECAIKRLNSEVSLQAAVIGRLVALCASLARQLKEHGQTAAKVRGVLAVLAVHATLARGAARGRHSSGGPAHVRAARALALALGVHAALRAAGVYGAVRCATGVLAALVPVRASRLAGARRRADAAACALVFCGALRLAAGAVGVSLL